MSLTITLTGTGGAQLVPVFGCELRGVPTGAFTGKLSPSPL